MSLKYGILGLLNYGPSSGYDINIFFRDSLAFFWEAQTSQIYRELTSLEQNGFAESEILVQYDKPNKRIFRITPNGRTEFTNWMGKPFTDDYYLFKCPLLMKLFFAAGQDKIITSDMLNKFIFDMKEAYEAMNGVSRHISNVVDEYPSQQNDSFYWKLTADFGYRFYTMAIEWAENALIELDKQ